MIAFNESHAQRFPRTLQRLEDAQEAIDRGEFTAAVLLIRSAIDTAAHEVFGRSRDSAMFIHVVTQEVDATRLTQRKVRKMRKRSNVVAHGGREGYAREALRMLTLFRAIAARWLERHDDCPELAPEELTTV